MRGRRPPRQPTGLDVRLSRRGETAAQGDYDWTGVVIAVIVITTVMEDTCRPAFA